MPDLTWAEREAVAELAGMLTSVASLCAFRPDTAAGIRTAVVLQLGPAERDLVRRLYDLVEDEAPRVDG